MAKGKSTWSDKARAGAGQIVRKKLNLMIESDDLQGMSRDECIECVNSIFTGLDTTGHDDPGNEGSSETSDQTSDSPPESDGDAEAETTSVEGTLDESLNAVSDVETSGVSSMDEAEEVFHMGSRKGGRRDPSRF
jgi:hypothetical protein